MTLPFKVYIRRKGMKSKKRIAAFDRLIDAANYGQHASMIRFKDDPTLSVIVVNHTKKVAGRFIQGRLIVNRKLIESIAG